MGWRHAWPGLEVSPMIVLILWFVLLFGATWWLAVAFGGKQPTARILDMSEMESRNVVAFVQQLKPQGR